MSPVKQRAKFRQASRIRRAVVEKEKSKGECRLFDGAIPSEFSVFFSGFSFPDFT
jgi:hypothetical protein